MEAVTLTAAEIDERLAAMVPSPLRRDLIIRRQFFNHEEYYVVKDPLALTYFRLHPDEAVLVGLLDGERKLSEIAQLYLQKYPNSERTLEQIAGFVNQLSMGGLLHMNAERFVHNARLGRNAAQSLLMIWAKIISGVLFFKVPLIDPSPWLGKFAHAIRFVWTKWFVGFSLLLFTWTFCLLLANREAFAAPRIDFFSTGNLVLLWVCIILIKTCHEFGHASTCRHFGGEVHEMGVCLLCFTPAGYVDASDAWMMRHKRHKIYTTIAGVFTEFIIASISAHLWLVLPDGVWHNLAFNAMLVSSVNTLVFNANPLMRFDGYYLVCDLLEIPNLRTKAIAYCSYHMQRFFVGYRNLQQEIIINSETRGRAFLIYAIMAYIYMIFVIYGLTQIFARVLKPYGLENFGLIIGFFVEGSFAAFPFIKVFMDAFKPGAHIVKTASARGRIFLTLVVLGVIAAISFFIPSHFTVTQQAIVMASNGEQVSSVIPGIVKKVHVTTGQWVEAGQLLATLDNADITTQLTVRESELQLAKFRYYHLQGQGSWVASEALPEAAKSLEVATAGYDRALADKARLELRAKAAGYVMTPNVDKLEGSYSSAAKPIMRIADTRNLTLVVPLTEDEVQVIVRGGKVTGRWLGSMEKLETTISTVPGQAAKPADYFVGMMSFFGGPAPLQVNAQTEDGRPVYPLYFAEAKMDAHDQLMIEGMRAQVTVEGEKTTIGHRWWRALVLLWNLKVAHNT